MAEHHGLPGVFPPERIAPTLATIEQFNVPPTKYGAIDFAKPDGTLLKIGEFPLGGELPALRFLPARGDDAGHDLHVPRPKGLRIGADSPLPATISARTAPSGTSPTSSAATPESGASAPTITRT